MKQLLIYVLAFTPAYLHAECTNQQEKAEIPLVISIEHGAVPVGENHRNMDLIRIETPTNIHGVPLSDIEITKGEISMFYFPLRYKTKGNIVYSEFSAYKDTIKEYEVAVTYQNEKCDKYIQRYLTAYNKALKSGTPESGAP